jgi:predicted AAA+ superfamily ATPase
VDWDQLDRRLTEIDPTVSSATEWAGIAESMQSASAHKPDKQMSKLQKIKKYKLDLRDQYRQKLSEDTKNIVKDCPKFRILLLGKTGVGKSTLSSRVLGIPYQV